MHSVDITGCEPLIDRFMKTWSTRMYARCPIIGEVVEFFGPNIRALTREHAMKELQENGPGYCVVHDRIVQKIPCFPGTKIPDWSKAVDYDGKSYLDN